MALDDAPKGFNGALQTARAVVSNDGVRGLYRGFGTVVFGTIPARIIYLSTLEIVKSSALPVVGRMQLGEAVGAGATNFVAGGCASFVTQSVIVPIDVVSQRLMLEGAASTSGTGSGRLAGGVGGAAAVAAGGAAPRMGGIEMARLIVKQEGVGGLYRGLGASLATFVPSSAVWWSSYAFWQRTLWQQLDRWRGTADPSLHSSVDVVAVQTGAALLGGCTSATLTNPLDVIKTRLQTVKLSDRQAAPTFRSTLAELLAQDGARGLLRGVAPRMASTALWGTCMVSVYEFLKRLCALPSDA